MAKIKDLMAKAIIAILLTGVLWQFTQTFAGEKVFFKTYDDERFICDRDNLEFHLDPNGKLAALCNLSLESEGDSERGSSWDNAYEIDATGKLIKKYILPIVRGQKVSFKNTADAENSLSFCEEWGLPQAEDYICQLLKRKPRRQTELLAKAQGFALGSVGQIDFMTGIQENLDCPEGYISVPGNEDYATPEKGQSFCVMKYEASMDGAKAVSRTGSVPKTEITRHDAERACKANGENYHLITNSEWMTIARNIESNLKNWSGGEVGVGHLARGNSNTTEAAAASGDENPHFGTNHADFTHRRTHELTNGEVIWDMAGNVWEWVSDNLTWGQNGWKEYTAVEFSTDDRLRYAPQGQYSSKENVGRIYGGAAGAALRGGAWRNVDYAGVFAADLDVQPSVSNPYVGFRCAVTP